VPSHEARKFPSKPVSEIHLGPFLNKSVWYVGVSGSKLFFQICPLMDVFQ